MKSFLTIQILIKNNENSILETLESIEELKANIDIINIGCEDKTIDICKEFNCVINNINNKNLSSLRNERLRKYETNWVLFLEPWEVIKQGIDLIKDYRNPNCYKLNIIRNGIFSKQNRFWHKDTNTKFENYAFEYAKNEKAIDLDCYITSNNPEFRHYEQIINDWKTDKPLSKTAIYYSSILKLMNNNYEDFLNESDLFLHMNDNLDKSYYMTKYYQSMINLYFKKDLNKSLKGIIECIAIQPTMAEFWCLLGDIYYETKDYKKAKIFYENAIVLGSQRSAKNDWPLDIAKYKQYPEKMISNCSEILQSIKLYI